MTLGDVDITNEVRDTMRRLDLTIDHIEVKQVIAKKLETSANATADPDGINPSLFELTRPYFETETPPAKSEKTAAVPIENAPGDDSKELEEVPADMLAILAAQEVEGEAAGIGAGDAAEPPAKKMRSTGVEPATVMD